jgi:hypothetical protein
MIASYLRGLESARKLGVNHVNAVKLRKEFRWKKSGWVLQDTSAFIKIIKVPYITDSEIRRLVVEGRISSLEALSY